MNKLKLLLNLFSKNDLADFEKKCRNADNLAGRLLLMKISHPAWTENKIIAALGVSANTFNKVCTQAKDLLLKELSKRSETPFDEIYVVQKLILNGEPLFAQKLLNELEKEIEKKQLWLQLETLYIEASRVCYINGDLNGSVALGKKRDANAARLAKYIHLNSNIVNEMIRLEGFKNRKPDEKKYRATISLLRKEAFAINHHVLIHNTLHLDYMYTSRFLHDPQLVQKIILEMQQNAKKFNAAMNPLSKAIIKNTFLNFLTIYNGFGDPEKYIPDLKRHIEHAGNAAKANMCYAMLEYYLYQENIPKVMEWLEELKKEEDNSKYRQYKHIVFAIKSFLEEDTASFKSYFNSFYSDASHLDYPDMEVNLRIIELLMLMNNSDDYLLESKITALKKYMSRNVNKDRYSEERKIILLIEKNASGTGKTIAADLKQLANSNYRNIVFLEKRMRRMMN
jgi:plasmid maintenance system antidote protein VapI